MDGVAGRAGISQVTGVNLFLVRNSDLGASLVVPRQLRVINSIFDATGDDYYKKPLTFIDWATQQVQITNSVFRKNDSGTYPALSSWTPRGVKLDGTTTRWDADVLTVSTSNPTFQRWNAANWEGAVVTSDKWRLGLHHRYHWHCEQSEFENYLGLRHTSCRQ